MAPQSNKDNGKPKTTKATPKKVANVNGKNSTGNGKNGNGRNGNGKNGNGRNGNGNGRNGSGNGNGKNGNESVSGDDNKPKVQENPDKFIGSDYVQSLGLGGFKSFLENKTAALVMFYDASSKDCKRSKDYFAKAAATTLRENHAYAAVNCSVEGDLCTQEDANKLPHFRLYTKGIVVGTVKGKEFFGPQGMKSFVETCPTMVEPYPEPCPVFIPAKRNGDI